MLPSELRKAGFPEGTVKVFSSHSFRISAATESAAAGIPDWLVQVAEEKGGGGGGGGLGEPWGTPWCMNNK